MADLSILATLAATPPAWLDRSFFEKVVRHMENDPQAQLQDFNLDAGSRFGDNFSSSVFRVSVTFTSKFAKEPKTISTIVKVELQFPPELSHLVKKQYFRNEVEMYGKVLPEIQSLWLSADDKEILAPKLIYQSNEPQPVIVLEDVSVGGFSLLKKAPEDFEVSKKIARRLAKFHASTFYLVNEKKWSAAEFNYTLFSDPMLTGLIDAVFAAFIDVAKGWKEFERFLPNLESFSKVYLSQILKTFSVNTNEFGINVLNHSDFHLKNVLFKENAEDFYFVDFQICNFATPAIDLIYALYYFVSPENRKNHRSEFIATYYNQFVESLKKFGYLKVPPSLIDLQVELLRNGSFEVILSICMSIFFYADLKELAGQGLIFNPMAPGEGCKMLFQLPGFKEIILQELPRWVNNGFI